MRRSGRTVSTGHLQQAVPEDRGSKRGAPRMGVADEAVWRQPRDGAGGPLSGHRAGLAPSGALDWVRWEARLARPFFRRRRPPGRSIRRASPRLVRDGLGPLAVFFAGWKLVGLGVGIGLAVLFGVSVLVHERRRGQPAVVVRLASCSWRFARPLASARGARPSTSPRRSASTPCWDAWCWRHCARLGPSRHGAAARSIRSRSRSASRRRSETTIAHDHPGVGRLLPHQGRGPARGPADPEHHQYVLVAALSDAPSSSRCSRGLSTTWPAVLRRSPEWGSLIAGAQAAPPA